MPRANRNPPGGLIYHVLNRANRRQLLFARPDDYLALAGVVRETLLVRPMRILQFCMMPTHWHFVLWPAEDGELAAFMHYMTTTHAVRWNRVRGLTGTGHVYQGPYKFFPVQDDGHYFSLCRYVVRNPVRAGIVSRAEQWPWSSLQHVAGIPLQEGPVPLGPHWLDLVNQPQGEAELAALRRSVARGRPYGDSAWAERTAQRLGIVHTLRNPGRPSRLR